MARTKHKAIVQAVGGSAGLAAESGLQDGDLSDTQALKQVLIELWETSRSLMPSKRNRLIRQLYGRAGTANAQRMPHLAEAFNTLATRIAHQEPVAGTCQLPGKRGSTGTRIAGQRHEQPIWFERCPIGDVMELLQILEHLAPPPDMPVAELYWRVATYLDRNSARNHERRYQAWLKRGHRRDEPATYDPYQTQSWDCGETSTVLPGEAKPCKPLGISSPDQEAASRGVRSLIDKDRPAYLALRNVLALTAIRNWEAGRGRRHDYQSGPVLRA